MRTGRRLATRIGFVFFFLWENTKLHCHFAIFEYRRVILTCTAGRWFPCGNKSIPARHDDPYYNCPVQSGFETTHQMRTLYSSMSSSKCYHHQRLGFVLYRKPIQYNNYTMSCTLSERFQKK